MPLNNIKNESIETKVSKDRNSTRSRYHTEEDGRRVVDVKVFSERLERSLTTFTTGVVYNFIVNYSILRKENLNCLVMKLSEDLYFFKEYNAELEMLVSSCDGLKGHALISEYITCESRLDINRYTKGEIVNIVTLKALQEIGTNWGEDVVIDVKNAVSSVSLLI